MPSWLYFIIGTAIAIPTVRYVVHRKLPGPMREDIEAKIFAVVAVVLIVLLWPVWLIIAGVVVPIWLAVFYKPKSKSETPAE